VSIVSYEIFVHDNGTWEMDSIEYCDGVRHRSSDAMRQGEITYADVRAIHDIEYPNARLGDVAFIHDNGLYKFHNAPK
jgi:hypothetical protein